MSPRLTHLAAVAVGGGVPGCVHHLQHLRPGDGLRLRIFVGEDDTLEGRPLCKELVRFFREHGLAGATVIKGIEGFGVHSRIHTAPILRLSEDLPVVIEVVDREDRIRGILPELDSMVREGLVTLERVEVRMYGHREEVDGEGGGSGAPRS